MFFMGFYFYMARRNVKKKKVRFFLSFVWADDDDCGCEMKPSIKVFFMVKSFEYMRGKTFVNIEIFKV